MHALPNDPPRQISPMRTLYTEHSFDTPRTPYFSPPHEPTKRSRGGNAASISVPPSPRKPSIPTLVGRRLPTVRACRCRCRCRCYGRSSPRPPPVRPPAAPKRWGRMRTYVACCMGTAGPGPPCHTDIIERQLVSAVMDACMDEPPNESLTPSPRACRCCHCLGRPWSEMHILDGRMRFFACLCPFRLDLSIEPLQTGPGPGMAPLESHGMT